MAESEQGKGVRNEHDSFVQTQMKQLLELSEKELGGKWGWRLETLLVVDDKLVCIGNLVGHEGVVFGGMGVVPVTQGTTPIAHCELLAMQAAADKAGLSQGMSHSVTNHSLYVGINTPIESVVKQPMTTSERAAELKQAYRMETKADFLAFVRMERPDVLAYEHITPDVVEQVHQAAVDNPQRFAAFSAPLPV